MTQMNLRRLSKYTMAGFTLIELMMVLAIISILMSVALPSYHVYTQKSQRTEGQVLLLEIQTYLERYYFNYQHYPENLSELRAYQVDEVKSENLYYQVTLETDQSCPPDTCYLLMAEHINGKESETLSIASSGDKQGPW